MPKDKNRKRSWIRTHNLVRDGKPVRRRGHMRQNKGARAAEIRNEEERLRSLAAKSLTTNSTDPDQQTFQNECRASAKRLRDQSYVPLVRQPSRRTRKRLIKSLRHLLRSSAPNENENLRGRELTARDFFTILIDEDNREGFSKASHTDKNNQYVSATNATMAAVSGTELKLFPRRRLVDGKEVVSLEVGDTLDKLDVWAAEMKELNPLGTIYYGGWFNDKAKPPYYEINVSLGFKDWNDAWLFGIQHDQDSVFHTDTYQELSTAGTGERGWKPKKKLTSLFRRTKADNKTS